jgi:hypothetical protein
LGAAFASQQRQVHFAGALDDHRVGGDRLAWADQDQVALAQACGVDQFGGASRAARDARGGGRQCAAQAFERARGAAAGRQFKVAAGQKQEHEHRNRIEVDVTASTQQRGEAAREGGADADRHRQVHAGHALPDAEPGAAPERLRRIQQRRQGQQQGSPVHQRRHVRVHGAVAGQVHRQRVHHHLHHRQAGDEQAAKHLLAFAFELFALA